MTVEYMYTRSQTNMCRKKVLQVLMSPSMLVYSTQTLIKWGLSKSRRGEKSLHVSGARWSLHYSNVEVFGPPVMSGIWSAKDWVIHCPSGSWPSAVWDVVASCAPSEDRREVFVWNELNHVNVQSLMDTVKCVSGMTMRQLCLLSNLS